MVFLPLFREGTGVVCQPLNKILIVEMMTPEGKCGGGGGGGELPYKSDRGDSCTYLGLKFVVWYPFGC